VASYDQVLPHVYHVRLRDSSKDQLQVRVGQGLIEYGKLISQLARFKYDRALSVDMMALEGVDQMAEMRKMRLLLESLL
jgi:sugar phosphate isomerase/epimerase